MVREPEIVTRYRRLALENDPVAQYKLGDLYRLGYQVKRDLNEAVVWLVRSARQGNADAVALLRKMAADGVDVRRRVDDLPGPIQPAPRLDLGAPPAEESRRVMEPEPALPAVPAPLDPHDLPLPQIEPEADPLRIGEEAVDPERLRAAIAKGDAAAMVALGNACREGREVPADPAEAFRLYTQAAKAGDARGQYSLGVMYDLGLGVTQSDAHALKWYREAARQGDSEAQFNLGNMIRQGRGVEASPEVAAKWFKQAADQGEPGALFALGAAYESGAGVERDEIHAVELYRRAADLGLAHALHNLSNMLRQGRGADADPVEAAMLCRRAAEQGLPEAQYNYAVMLALGVGVDKNPAGAVQWFRRAARSGDPRGEAQAAALEKRLGSAGTEAAP